MNVIPGTLLEDRYRIVSELGAGGMGTVYRAVQLGMGGEVAIKVLDRLFAGGELAARFAREARAMGRLDHPGCVRVFGHGRIPDGRPYLAMELLDGPSLARAIAEEGPLSIEAAVAGTEQVLAALGHAHARGVLHRDVKPENLLYTGAPRRLVLIDFGLARLRDEDPLTAAGLCAGSPSYLAPERLRGEDGDARTDLYALGVVLYEMLTGRRPFVGQTPVDIARQHLALPPPPIERRDVPPELLAVVLRALEKDPVRRFQDAAEMSSALSSTRAESSDPVAVR
jgi:serine/threonine-protein kinase